MEVTGGEPSDSTKAMLAEFERRKRVSQSFELPRVLVSLLHVIDISKVRPIIARV